MSGRRRARRWTAAAWLIAVIAAGGAHGTTAAATEGMVVVPFEDAELVPLDPTRPEGPRMAVLWGDPASEPSAMLLEVGRGVGSLHVHSADYHLVVLEGTMRHRAAADGPDEGRLLGRGSYWFQPGELAHADSCLSERCLMFVKWEGPRDARLAEAPTRGE